MIPITLAPSAYPPFLWRCCMLCSALYLLGWAGAAAALEPAQGGSPAMAAPVFTLHTETYPDTGAPRPAVPASIQYTGVTGWLTPRQASSLGLTLAIVSGDTGAGRMPMAYELGLRWRTQLNPRAQLNVHTWARTAQQPAMHDAQGMIWYNEQNAFGTRLEVQWASSRTYGLVPEFGAIGVQLQGNSRLLLRARGGGPMVYYRTKF